MEEMYAVKLEDGTLCHISELPDEAFHGIVNCFSHETWRMEDEESWEDKLEKAMNGGVVIDNGETVEVVEVTISEK
jgi:hypothetical protein